MTYTETACAKLNLSLDIIRKRPDGFHDMRMVMQSIDLCDTVAVREQPGTEVSLDTSLAFLPKDGSNIAVKAANIFFREAAVAPRGLHITLDKRIPVCAGMAGGSSNGAAVLRLLRRLYAGEMPLTELERIAALVGSDVPYCVRGGTALAEGRGEILTDLPPLPPCWFVVCKPAFSISTPELFSQVQVKKLRCHPDTAGMITALHAGDLDGVAHRLYNVFEEVLPRKYAEVFTIKRLLLDRGALASSMTGSGPTVMGLFEDRNTAASAAEDLRTLYPSIFLAANTGKQV